MKDVSKVLGRHRIHEPVLWAGQPAWSEHLFLWFFAFMALTRAALVFWAGDWVGGGIYAAGAGGLAALAVFLRQISGYALTRQAVYRTQGLLGREIKAIPIKSIASVSIQQGPLDRILGIGAVVLYMKEGESRYERLAGIKDPGVVCRKIAAML